MLVSYSNEQKDFRALDIDISSLTNQQQHNCFIFVIRVHVKEQGIKTQHGIFLVSS